MPTAADVMTKDEIPGTPKTALRELASIIARKHINGGPVVEDEGKILGVVCESDLVAQNKPLHIPTVFVILDTVIPLENPWRLQKEFKRLTATTVEEPAVTVAPNADLAEAARLMVEKKFYTIPVMDGEQLVGILGKADVIRSLYD